MRRIGSIGIALALMFGTNGAHAADLLNGDAVSIQYNAFTPFTLNGTVGAGYDITLNNFLFDFNSGAGGDVFSWDSLPQAGYLGGASSLVLQSLAFADGSTLTGFQVLSTILTGVNVSTTASTVTISWTTSPTSYPGPGNLISGRYITTSSVPEPATLALFGLGLAGIGAMRRKKLAA